MKWEVPRDTMTDSFLLSNEMKLHGALSAHTILKEPYLLRRLSKVHLPLCCESAVPSEGRSLGRSRDVERICSFLRASSMSLLVHCLTYRICHDALDSGVQRLRLLDQRRDVLLGTIACQSGKRCRRSGSPPGCAVLVTGSKGRRRRCSHPAQHTCLRGGRAYQ